MKAQFLDLQAAADFLGPGAVEVEPLSNGDFRHRAPARGLRTTNSAGARNRTSLAVLRTNGDCVAERRGGLRGSTQHCGD